MKKILLIIFLYLLTSTNVSTYEICGWVVNDAYVDHLNNYPNEDHNFFVVKGDDGRCEYGHGLDEKSGFNDCEKHRKEKGIKGECQLFAIGKKIILKIKNVTGCIKGNCTNGIGTMEWSNGDKYTGEWKNSETHGKGTLTWVNGDKYVGNWKNGKMHGLGKMTWSTGASWEGIWKNGQQFKDSLETDKVVWDDSVLRTRKKYIFKYLGALRTFIKKESPTVFKELKFVRKTDRKITGKEGQAEFGKANKKYKTIKYHAYIFKAHYKDDETVWFFVNAKYKSQDKSHNVALKYAKIIGQIPAFLRKGGLSTIVIHPGKRRWFASASDRKFTIYPDTTWNDHEKDIIHEASHVAMDNKLLNNPAWKAAVDADGKYITEYARKNRWEDSAETVTMWIGLRCVDDISNRVKKKTLKGIPNRIKILDELNLDTTPMVCNK